MKCSNCDGYGWLELDEFRERTLATEILGDDPSIYWLNSIGENPFSFAMCPDCDGFGEEVDEDYAEDLAIMKIIKDYENRIGFYRYYNVDFDERKVTMGVEFVWRTKRWKLVSGLPTFGKFARMWNGG